MPVTLKAFTESKDAAELQRLMKEAMKKAAGSASVKFIAAKNYKKGSKFMSLFMVVDKPAEFTKVVANASSEVPKSEGTATITKLGSANIRVKITASRGQLSDAAIANLVTEAVGNDPGYVGEAPERKEAAPPPAPAAPAKPGTTGGPKPPSS